MLLVLAMVKTSFQMAHFGLGGVLPLLSGHIVWVQCVRVVMGKCECRCGLEPTQKGTSRVANGAQQAQLRTGEREPSTSLVHKATPTLQQVTSYADIAIGKWMCVLMKLTLCNNNHMETCVVLCCVCDAISHVVWCCTIQHSRDYDKAQYLLSMCKLYHMVHWWIVMNGIYHFSPAFHQTT